MLKKIAIISVASILVVGAAHAQSTTEAQPAEQAQPDSAPAQQPDAVVAVTEADVRAGATVNDQSGQLVGTVESVSAEGALISTGTARARIPFSAIGKTTTGLVTTVTKAQIESATTPDQANAEPK